MREDDTKVRMQDTLDLFEEICFLPETQKKPLILMLNKMDLFKEKIKRRKLKSFFPDYNGIRKTREQRQREREMKKKKKTLTMKCVLTGFPFF
jgi:hypothetical protein